MMRLMFRVVEYLQGFSGYLLSHEVYLSFLDAVLCIMLIFNVVHPSEEVALMNGRTAAKRAWNIEKIIGYPQRVSSQNLGRGFA